MTGLRYGTVVKAAWFFAVIIIGIVPRAWAAPLGDPTPRFWDRGFSAGFDYDFTLRPVLIGGQKGDVETQSYQAVGTIGLPDRLSLFARFGIGRVADHDENGLFFADLKLAYGGGIKVKLFDWEGIRVGAGAQYSEFNSGEKATGHKPGLQIDVYWRETEAFGGIAYDGFDWISPYIGVLYSDVYGKRKGSFLAVPIPRLFIDEQDPLGLFFGISVRPRPWILITGEGRLQNQSSYSFSASYLF